MIFRALFEPLTTSFATDYYFQAGSYIINSRIVKIITSVYNISFQFKLVTSLPLCSTSSFYTTISTSWPTKMIMRCLLKQFITCNTVYWHFFMSVSILFRVLIFIIMYQIGSVHELFMCQIFFIIHYTIYIYLFNISGQWSCISCQLGFYYISNCYVFRSRFQPACWCCCTRIL